MALGAKDLSSVSGSVQVVVLLAILVTICRWTVVTVQLDIHSYWANELKADPLDPTSATVATEFVSAAVSANPPNSASFTEVSADNPHVRFVDVTRHGYVSMELTPASLHTRLRAISERTDPNASVETLRSFTVESGRPGIQPA